MTQHPETVVRSTGQATAGSDLAYVAFVGDPSALRLRDLFTLTGWGATPLDAIRDLLDAEQRQ